MMGYKLHVLPISFQIHKNPRPIGNQCLKYNFTYLKYKIHWFFDEEFINIYLVTVLYKIINV